MNRDEVCCSSRGLHVRRVNGNTDERGVTLLELILSLTILGLLLPVIAAGMTHATGEWNRAVDRLEARQQATMLLQRVEREIRGGRRFVAEPNVLYFLNEKDQLIRYQISSTGLLLRDEAVVGTSIIGSKIRSLTFTPDPSGKLVRLRLTIVVGRFDVTVDQLLAGREALP